MTDTKNDAAAGQELTIRAVHKIFPVGHFVISLLFIASALALLGFAAAQLWDGLQPGGDLSSHNRLQSVLQSIAILTVAVAALELGQTILEEEVQREAHMSAPTRVRRFLSRFMVVLVVAMSIETLVVVFKFTQEAPGTCRMRRPSALRPPRCSPRGAYSSVSIAARRSSSQRRCSRRSRRTRR